MAYFGYPNPYLSYPISHYLLWYCKVALMDWDLYVFNRLYNVFKTFYAISVIIGKNYNLRKLQCLPERLKSMVFGEKKFYFLKTNHIFKSDTAFHSNKIFISTAFSKKNRLITMINNFLDMLAINFTFNWQWNKVMKIRILW